MGNTEQEQAEAMKCYIRGVVIPEYVKNFNKGLSAEDIKFYGKIHFDRDRSKSKGNNMHCRLIFSRKDQSNTKKLSPLTNHKNTKKGTVKGGGDRTNLFRQAEQGFDKLFSYDRQLTESFEYCNTMKNGSIAEQLKMQEKQISDERKNSKDNIQTVDFESKFANSQNSNIADTQTINQENKQSINLPDLGLSSALGLFTPDVSIQEEEQSPVKKKIPKKGIRR